MNLKGLGPGVVVYSSRPAYGPSDRYLPEHVIQVGGQVNSRFAIRSTV